MIVILALYLLAVVLANLNPEQQHVDTTWFDRLVFYPAEFAFGAVFGWLR